MEIRVLGPVQAWAGGHRLELDGPITESLLAALVIDADSEVTFDSLVEVGWASDPPATVRRQIRNRLARLRRTLLASGFPVHVLATDRKGYVLRTSGTQVDLAELRRLSADGAAAGLPGDPAAGFRQALRLWRGPAFAGLESLRLLAVADQLAEQRLSLWERCLSLELDAGLHHKVVADLVGLQKLHPTRERLASLLMLGLYRSGRQADALAVYATTRRHLAEELGLSPSKELRGLHDDILRDSQGLKPAEAVAITAAPPGPVRDIGQFLPRDIDGFVGRDEDLAWLDQQAAGDNAAMIITAIDGAAGIGKTALAVHWTHRALARFPDGQLYVNLRGFDERRPLRPFEALTHLLRCMGVTASELPVDEESAAARFRSMLAGRRMLLLLDNARSVEQIRPLMPGDRRTVVLVTSRERLSGLVASQGARRITLGLLGAAQSRALVAWIIGERRVAGQEEAVRRLIELCGRLPLALRIAATHLADRPERAVASFVDDLTSGDRVAILSVEDDPYSCVQAVLDQSCRALDPGLQRVFAHLGIFPGHDFGAELIAPLIGGEAQDTVAALEKLAACHLIEEIRPGRYAMHDLVHEFAVKAFGDRGASRQEPLTRLFEVLDDLATQACAHIDYQSITPQDGPTVPTSVKEAMAWLESEKATLAGSISIAAELGLTRQAESIAKTLWMFFYHSGHTSDWIATFEAAYEATSRLGESAIKYYILNALGSGYVIAGRYDQAMAAHRECIVAREKLGDADGVARSRSNLAMSFFRLARHEEGLAELQTALRIYRDKGDRAMEAFLLSGNLPDVLLAMGRPDEAIAAIRTALDMIGSSDNPIARARALQCLGDTYLNAARPDLAIESLSEAIGLARQTGNHRLDALITETLGEAYLDLGDFQGAIAQLELAVEAGRRMGTLAIECDALVYLGCAHLGAGSTGKAQTLLEQAYRMADLHGLETTRALALAGLGRVLRRTDPVGARDNLTTALSTLEKVSHRQAARVRQEVEELEHAESPTIVGL